jgi:peptide deformylase
MAILKIARMGHPVLIRPAEPVPDPTAPEIRRLIADMAETMEDAQGIGLAAPQVHVSKQVVVFEVDDNPRYPKAGDLPLTVLINPVITPIGVDEEQDWEGCLSVPGLRGMELYAPSKVCSGIAATASPAKPASRPAGPRR